MICCLSLNLAIMETMYNADRIASSESINPADFLRKSIESFIFPKKPYDILSREEEIKELMGVSLTDEEFNQVALNCRPNRLDGCVNNWNGLKIEDTDTNSGVKSIFKPVEITPESLKFNCVQKAKALRENQTFSFRTLLKYSNDKCPINKIKTDTPPDLVPGSDVLFRVRIYHPFKHIVGVKALNKPNFYHDLVVLGSDTLDVLRDKILCSNDMACNTDVSEDPEAEPIILTKDHLKSGFLFIQGTFYNDHRNANNIDYSECIRNWASERKIGPLATAVMEQTTFNQLEIKLGYPQVYQHLGDCEHLFTFSDIEMLQPFHSCHSSSYPMYTAIAIRKARYCLMCGDFVAKWKVEENERLPFDPSYFCDGCFYSYNYVDGVKVGQFKAYPYYDSVVAL